ncbi:hypothetical protein ACFL5Z_12625 [Planctomycetota bacterium]
MKKSREHKTRKPRVQYPLGLPSHLAVLKLEDIVSSIIPKIQIQYIENVVGHESYRDRLQHVRRRRPLIYFDFNNAKLLRRCSPERMPDKLAITVLAWLFRNTSITIIDFHLLPRSKRTLCGTGKGDLRKALAVEVWRLQGFIAEDELPIEISSDQNHAYLRAYARYVNSNINQATELAECAQHQLELDEYERAATLAEQALIIDPDCKLAVSVVHRLIGCQSVDRLYRPAVLALGCQTRALLALINNIDRISAFKEEDGLAEEIITKAHERIVLLQRRLRKLWSWLQRSDEVGTDGYSEVLYFIGQAALAKVGRGDISYDDAFRQVMSHPAVSEAINDCVLSKSRRNAEYVRNEIELRFWRLLFVDGWLPAVTTIEGFAGAFHGVMKSRFRVSNTPDGAARIPGGKKGEDLYRHKKQEQKEKEQEWWRAFE